MDTIMTKEDKKKRYLKLLGELSKARKEGNQKKLSDHDFYIDGLKENANLFDELLFQAVLQQAESLSLTLNKPYSYQVESAEYNRLSREAYDTLDKAAILRPTRIGPLCLIG